MIALLTDSIERLGKSTLINNRHEQASGFTTEGYARVAGQPFAASLQCASLQFLAIQKYSLAHQ
jgi:thiamine pyrophosphate-dependent acetolactate synthase large subunit-like protein